MDKFSYSLGMSVASNLIQSGVKSLEFADFSKAVKDVIESNKADLTPQEANQILKTYFDNVQKEKEAQQKKLGEENKRLGKEWLSENAKRNDVVTTASGLQYKVIKEGTGKTPTSHSQVKCHYEGDLINGQKFDSSYDRKQPATFGLMQVIKGWQEGLQLMKEGSIYELYIPYDLAYGEVGMPPTIPPCSTLVFKVELIEVK